MAALDSIIGAGEFIFDTTAVFAKGIGILALQFSNVSHFQEYDKVAEKDFTLIQEQTYLFKQNDNGSVSCNKELPRNRNKNYLTIKKGETYKVADINYVGQIDKTSNNNMAETIAIQVGDTEEKIVWIKLDEKDYGLSIKSRIDLLELCR